MPSNLPTPRALARRRAPSSSDEQFRASFVSLHREARFAQSWDQPMPRILLRRSDLSKL